MIDSDVGNEDREKRREISQMCRQRAIACQGREASRQKRG